LNGLPLLLAGKGAAETGAGAECWTLDAAGAAATAPAATWTKTSALALRTDAADDEGGKALPDSVFSCSDAAEGKRPWPCFDTYAVENWSIRLAIVREEASSILRVWGGMEAESSSR